MGAITTQDPASETTWAISSHHQTCHPGSRPNSRDTMLYAPPATG